MKDQSSKVVESALPPGQQFFTDTQLAEITGLKRQTFAGWRCHNCAGPAYVRFGRLVRYPRAAVIQWMMANLIIPQQPIKKRSPWKYDRNSLETA